MRTNRHDEANSRYSQFANEPKHEYILHTHAHTHTHTCLCVCICINIYTHIRVCACVCVFVYACVYIHIHKCVCACIHIFFNRNYKTMAWNLVKFSNQCDVITFL
jgi:hypothetical protein